jgi:pimeloyl-ACP methyl ester carboxylesterase
MGTAWMKSHPNFLESALEAKDLFAGIPANTIKQQNDISQNWHATNWSGVCDELTKVSGPTLIITGNHDNNVPTANPLIIAGKVPGAWLVQIKNAGHALFAQYPDKVNKVLQTFLSTSSVCYYWSNYNCRCVCYLFSKVSSSRTNSFGAVIITSCPFINS